MGSEVILAFIAFMGAVTAGFFKLIADQSKAQAQLSEAIADLSKNSERQARAQEDTTKELKKGNSEAAQRNGHLGEQNEKITELVVAHSKEAQGLVDLAASKVAATMAGAMKSLKTQHVDTLNVQQSNIEHEIINDVTENKS